MTELKQVTIYTDGACIGNPGPGGYGVVLLYKDHRREHSGGYRKTTNNRMELLAAIAALEALKEKCSVTVYSDSEYVVKSIEQGWAKKWKENGWQRNKKGLALNSDLWDRLLALCSFHEVDFRWLKGHAGNRENERCDALAMQAATQPSLGVDEVYETTVAIASR